jgi:hypothetical protein
MEIAFTGTREGMSQAQKLVVRNILSGFWAARGRVHHGCCIGADADFHAIARELGFFIIGHPAYEIGHPMRADLDCDELRNLLPPLDRNSVIIEESLILIATPLQAETTRSGTWSTIRKTRRPFMAHRIVFPDGHVEVGRDNTSLAMRATTREQDSSGLFRDHPV